MSDREPGDPPTEPGGWLTDRFADAAGRLAPPGPAPVGELLRRGRRRRARRRAIAAGGMASAAAVVAAAVMLLPSGGHSKLKVTAGAAASSSHSRAAAGSSAGPQIPAGPPETAPAVTATTAPTITTATTAPGATSASTAEPARTGPCHSAQLGISEQALAPGQYLHGAAGHSAVVILFKNTSSAPCTLSGYPGAAGLDASGAQVTQASRTPSGFMGGLSAGSTTPPAVVLAPGEMASAMVEGTDNPVGGSTTCPALSGLLATAPNTRPSVHLPAAPGDCSGLSVHPVVAGTTGSQQG